MWKTRGRVPAEHCPSIERETGIRCERLRPDVAWDVLRAQSAAASVESEDSTAEAGDSSDEKTRA
jgi:DNA-binding transcriptional regulator YdaS (Cro superfamily)